MPKTYAAGDKVLAADMNGVVKTAGTYGASSGGNDTYAITVTPAPSAYAEGDEFTFKADVANTGAATLNVNTLGAVSILTKEGAALATGDILAGDYVRVKHDGTNFRIVSYINPIMKTGVTTHDVSTTGDQTIAHGAGRIPKMVFINSIRDIATGPQSWGIFDGTTQTVTHNSIAAGGGQGTESAKIIRNDETGKSVTATIAVDITNITLTWSKTSTPTGNALIQWAVIA